MQKSTFLKYTITLLLAAIGGFLIAKKMYEPSKTSFVIDTSHIQYYSPVSGENAHVMSARFRNAAGLCPDDSRGGLFEFSDSTAYDLVRAVEAIKRETGTTTVTTLQYFRAIFGIDAAGKTRLIVTKLNTQNREQVFSTKIIDGHLPCPLLCDINLSDVIMGMGTTRDPCR